MTTASDRTMIADALGLPELTEEEARLVDWLAGWDIGSRLAALVMRVREHERGNGLLGWPQGTGDGPTVTVLGREVGVREARAFAEGITEACDAVTPLGAAAKAVLASVAASYGESLGDIAARAGVDLDSATASQAWPLVSGLTVRVAG